MANEQNLIPFTSDQDREEARKNGKKGGIASGKARREKRKLADAVREMMQSKAPEKYIKKLKQQGGFNCENDADMFAAAAFALGAKALNGDVAAVKAIMELLGENAPNKVEVSGTINPLAGLTTEELKKLADDD